MPLAESSDLVPRTGVIADIGEVIVVGIGYHVG